MKKKIAIIGICVASFLVAIWFAAQNIETGIAIQSPEPEISNLVIMPTKVSRPGCEETDTCYIPSTITISKGQTVTWENQDAAFHSVTSGFYDNPSDLFDSGHMDPGEFYQITFDEQGSFDYFCTLHPWMYGQVIVQ